MCYPLWHVAPQCLSFANLRSQVEKCKLTMMGGIFSSEGLANVIKEKIFCHFLHFCHFYTFWFADEKINADFSLAIAHYFVCCMKSLKGQKRSSHVESLPHTLVS